MGKKIQILKETFPRKLPKFSLPKISIPKLSDLKPSNADQLSMCGIILLFCAIPTMTLTIQIFGLTLLVFLIPLAIGSFCFYWFMSAAQQLRLNDWLETPTK